MRGMSPGFHFGRWIPQCSRRPNFVTSRIFEVGHNEPCGMRLKVQTEHLKQGPARPRVLRVQGPRMAKGSSRPFLGYNYFLWRYLDPIPDTPWDCPKKTAPLIPQTTPMLVKYDSPMERLGMGQVQKKPDGHRKRTPCLRIHSWSKRLNHWPFEREDHGKAMER